MMVIKQKNRQMGQNYLTNQTLQVRLNPASKYQQNKQMNKTVKELRQAGYKVRCLHFRNKTNFLAGQWLEYPVNAPKGGKTEVHLISPEGVKAKGEAKCSAKDNYCRRTGVAIALGRALKSLEKEENPFEEMAKSVITMIDVASEIREKNIQRGIDSLKEQQALEKARMSGKFKQACENIKIEKQVFEF